MARSKFFIDESEVMDAVEEEIVVVGEAEQGKSVASVKEEVPVAANNEKKEEPIEKKPQKTQKKAEEKSEDLPKENAVVPVAQARFSYKKKKETRTVKKLVLVTPTMNSEITKLLETTYDGMPFNMLVNDLLKDFLEKHGLTIDENAY